MNEIATLTDLKEICVRLVWFEHFTSQALTFLQRQRSGVLLLPGEQGYQQLQQQRLERASPITHLVAPYRAESLREGWFRNH